MTTRSSSRSTAQRRLLVFYTITISLISCIRKDCGASAPICSPLPAVSIVISSGGSSVTQTLCPELGAERCRGSRLQALHQHRANQAQPPSLSAAFGRLAPPRGAASKPASRLPGRAPASRTLPGSCLFFPAHGHLAGCELGFCRSAGESALPSGLPVRGCPQTGLSCTSPAQRGHGTC